MKDFSSNNFLIYDTGLVLGKIYNLPVIVAGLGLLFGWNTAHHFSFKLTYTISRTWQVGVVEYTLPTKKVQVPIHLSNACYVSTAPTSLFADRITFTVLMSTSFQLTAKQTGY